MEKDDKEIIPSGKAEEPKKQFPGKKQQTVTIMFKENRRFDLHIGRDVLVFKGREIKPIPVEWLKHRDFIQVQKYFTVKGV